MVICHWTGFVLAGGSETRILVCKGLSLGAHNMRSVCLTFDM